MQYIHITLNPRLPWQEQHSTRRQLFSPANWTQILGRNYWSAKSGTYLVWC